MFRRILLFAATNIAILVVLSVTIHLLGIDRWLAAQGMHSIAPLLVIAAVMGMGGAFISLAMSKWVAKRAMGVQIIDNPRTPVERWLVDTVARQARAAGIGMPEVGVFNAPEMNAFATGMDKNHALVAVSTGLLQHMDRAEVEAVLGHEVSHVANGDMVTMTLIQGVLNTFVFVLAHVIGRIVDRAVFKNEHGNGIGALVTTIFAQIVLGILATMILMWFSRWREFRADAGGARLTSRQSMMSALERLRLGADHPLPDQFAAFGISGGRKGGFARLFMSHPPLGERIEALRAGR